MNTPDKYVSTGVFTQDISDPCPVVCVRDVRIQKSKPRVITKRNLKNFSEQAFLHNLYFRDLDCITAVPEPDLVLSLFADFFSTIVDNILPSKNERLKVDRMPGILWNYQK
jgi:hypothetical protein